MAEQVRIAKRLYRFLRKELSDRYWTWRGKGIRNPELPSCPRSMLFLCKGNICRSAYAEGYFQKIARERNLDGKRCSSAGFVVRMPIPSPDLAVQVAGTLGIEMTEHRSTLVTAKMIEDNDLVLVMEHGQALYLRREYPEHASKIFLLPLFDADASRERVPARRYNIPDPYGGTEEDFLESFRMVGRSIDGLLSMLQPPRDSLR